MIPCPKCQALATPGASDCPKCGYHFSAVESEPESQKPGVLLHGWLLLGGFWAVVTLGSMGYALYAKPLEPGVAAFLWAHIVTAATRLVGVIAMWYWKKWGFYLFLASAGMWLLLSTNVFEAIPPLAGAGIMWVLAKREWSKFH